MTDYERAAILSLCAEAFHQPQTSRDELADLVERLDPAFEVVAIMLRNKRPALPVVPSYAWVAPRKPVRS